MCGTKALGQRESIVVEVGDDDRIDAPGRERGDGRQADRTGPDHERNLPGDDARHRHVSLADRERVGQGDRVDVGVGRHHPGEHLGHEEELAEAARRVGVLADHLHAPGSDEGRDARDPRADRELVRASITVADDLPDELVAHHHVTVGVPHEHPRRVVRVRVVHVVDVRRADGSAHRAHEQLTRTRHRVVGLADLEASPTQHQCAHPTPGRSARDSAACRPASRSRWPGDS